MEETSTPKRRFPFDKKYSKLVVILVVLVLVGAAGYFYLQYQKTNSLLQNPNQASQEETKNLINQVGKLIQLPTNESPTIATVSDISKLSDQQFFKNAVNGDKVLIYSQAQKAILYRPSINKIIEVAPVNIGRSASPNANPQASGTSSPTGTGSATPSVKVTPILTPTPSK